ncbi:MAG: hypothetical protein HOQ05_02440 [Corynebacteriales bacterium]|nr:hypothetical protein [Mycobacteriales bacterium]
MRLRWCALVLALAGILGGCGGVPEGGVPIAVRDRDINQAGENLSASVAISGPKDGDGPMDTFNSLLNATAVTQNRSRLAETFFAPGARRAFERTTAVNVVRVQEAPRVVDTTADHTTLTMSVQMVGLIDGSGVYRADTRRLELSLRLVQLNGLWLFDSAPEMVLVRESDFARAMRPVVVYYPAVTGFTLVPEQRYVDSSIRVSSLATPLVGMLLGGPSASLAPVTRPPFAQNVRLRGNVTVGDDRDVVLDLTTDVESVSAEQINTFIAQVGWTLRRYRPGDIRVQVGGRDIAVKGVEAKQSLGDWASYNPAQLVDQPLFVIQDGQVRELGESRPPIFGGERATSDVLTGAISLDGRAAAVVRDEGEDQQLWVGDAYGSVQNVLSAEQISRPSWGSSTSSALTAVDGDLLRVSRAGVPSAVEVTGVSDIRAVRLSYDGSRVVLVAGEPDQARAYMGLVVADASGEPVAIRGVTALSAPVAQVEDVAWATPVSVFVAGREFDGMAALWEVDVDGSAVEPTPRTGLRPAPVAVAAAPTESGAEPVYVDLGGQLFQRFRESWTLAPERVSMPFYPG